MAKKRETGAAKKPKLNFRSTLTLFALIPMIITSLVLSVILVSTVSTELKSSACNSMVQIIEHTGTAFDYTTIDGERELRNFTTSPVVKELLRNPDDAATVAKAQAYTEEYFGNLEEWEGIYIADWDSKVLTHPVPAVVGKVMREGDRLEELRNAMLNSDGLYNVGIIVSPASGNLIMSMYAPVYDDDGTPIGYVGAGTYVSVNASKFSDVSALGLSSAYIYFVDKEGTMLFHPDEEKIGNPVENAAVKGLVERLANGEKPEPGYVKYLYKGINKYAAYYIGQNSEYIAVLTADEDDVMADANRNTTLCLVLCAGCLIFFIVLAIIIAKRVSKPLEDVTDSLSVLSTGDITVGCNAKTNIKEIFDVAGAFGNLKNALMASMTNVKNSASTLNDVIINVDDKTSRNVDSISQINDAINEVADTSQVVATHAQDMSEKTMELGNNIETLTANVSALYESSLTIRNANNEATDCMKSVLEGANESVSAMQNITDKINETNNAISAISAAVLAIETIAEQTNLLSLNASIEAARAGEAGRGFAVVADEIRTLADSSAESAKEIKRIIENIIALSSETVDISNRVFSVVSKEQTDIETTQDRFTILSDSVESSINGIATIQEMAQKLDEIKVKISEAATELGAVSEELGASAEEVAASCQVVTDACVDTQTATVEMRGVNESMIEATEFFKLS